MSKTNYDVAHEFAYGATHGKSSNIFIDGDVIYSYGYHFPIAKRIGGTILFTNREYSVTTSQHKAYVRSAVSHLNIIYCDNPRGTHTENQEAYLKAIESVLPKWGKARKPEIYANQIQWICREAKKYCDFFGIKMEKELAKFVNDKVTYAVAYEKMRKIEENKAKEKERLERERIKKFHNFEVDYVYYIDFCELRVNANNQNRIETTKGVQIPFELGKRFYERLLADEVKVGDELLCYRVLKVDDKEIHIGCHKFKRKYLVEFGARVFE